MHPRGKKRDLRASPNALYSRLMSDLSDQFSPSLISSIKEGYEPWPGISPKEMAALSISRSLLKKFKPASTDKQDAAALLKFLQVNYACENWELQLNSLEDELLWNEFKTSIYDFWFPSRYPIVSSDTDFFHYGRVGPGAAIGARSGDFYSKMFASPLSCTSRYLYLAYKDYIRNFPEWASGELTRQAHYGEADIVSGNRLSFVPKNEHTSRTICIEPSLNMFTQLGFGHILERRLLSCYGISMAEQPFKNRRHAFLGSLSDENVTIDLSSASDSISLRMLEACLPRDFFSILSRLRSPMCDVPGIGLTQLHMVSTMGNGFTFPLQTMLFACVVHAAAKVDGFSLRYPRGDDLGDFGVFGDDIICPKRLSRKVLRLLKLLGFEVNQAKTFVEGPFRESCGEDYFLGLNVRGVYIKRLQKREDAYAAVNQLNQFSTRTGIRLPKTVGYLLSRVRWQPVPRWENDDAGIKVPFSLVDGLQPVNKALQSTMYFASRADGIRYRILEGEIRGPRSVKRLIYNPSGLFVSFLQRSVNAFSIGVRHDPIYRRKLSVAPHWDATPTVHPYSGWFPWQRWNTAVYLNLFG